VEAPRLGKDQHQGQPRQLRGVHRRCLRDLPAHPRQAGGPWGCTPSPSSGPTACGREERAESRGGRRRTSWAGRTEPWPWGPATLAVFLAFAAPVPGPVLARGAGAAPARGRPSLPRARGRSKQALDNFNTIVTGFPGTASVDDALLEIGRYHLEVEGDDEKARAAFDQVAKRFPQSGRRARGLLLPGLADADPGQGRGRAWRTRVAQFTRVQRLYPGSEWVPRALHAAGLTHRKAGRLAEAVEFERPRLHGVPDEARPRRRAQFEVGEGLRASGRAPSRPWRSFQQVRNRFRRASGPRTRWSAPPPF
jgi:tetratricopeptide (TPR) repeat protein